MSTPAPQENPTWHDEYAEIDPDVWKSLEVDPEQRRRFLFRGSR